MTDVELGAAIVVGIIAIAVMSGVFIGLFNELGGDSDDG